MLSKLLSLDAVYTDRLRVAEKPGLLRNLAVIFAHSGDSWFWLAGLAILWLWGNNEWKSRYEIMVFGILLTATLVLILKLTVRRQRPEGEWGGVYRKTDPHSFPSGHAARAAMLAVLGIGLGPWWSGLLLTIWAPLVTLSRVAMGVHYLFDVVVGAFLGILIGIAVLIISPTLASLF